MKCYPYRFKTKKEMIDSFGIYWRNAFTGLIWVPDMDYLLGTEFPQENLVIIDSYHPKLQLVDGLRYWGIIPKILTNNKPKEPSYKPRKIIREL